MESQDILGTVVPALNYVQFAFLKSSGPKYLNDVTHCVPEYYLFKVM